MQYNNLKSKNKGVFTMKVAILGSGNGACAMAFEWARTLETLGLDGYSMDELVKIL